MVGLAGELHVAVLNAVVHHLYVVPRARSAHPLAARLVRTRLGGDRLHDLLHVGPRVDRATRHEGRAVARTLLTTGDAGTDEEPLLRLEVVRAPNRVGEERVAPVDDDVALLSEGQDRLDEVVDRLACLD